MGELAEVVAESIKVNDARAADEAKLMKAKKRAMAAEGKAITPTKSPTQKNSSSSVEGKMVSAPASSSPSLPLTTGEEEEKEAVTAAAHEEDESKDNNNNNNNNSD